MAKKLAVAESTLPSNKRFKEIEAYITTNAAGGDSINGLYNELVLNPVSGLIVAHAKPLADRMLALKRAAYKAANPLAITDPSNPKYLGPMERRADATYFKYVIAFAITGATDQWKYLCTLTNAFTMRATIAGEAAKVYDAVGMMPNDKWFQAQVKKAGEDKAGNGADAKGKAASVYLASIVDMSEKLIRFHNQFESEAVANILKTAKATLAKASKIEAKAKADAAAAAKIAKAAKEKEKAAKAAAKKAKK